MPSGSLRITSTLTSQSPTAAVKFAFAHTFFPKLLRSTTKMTTSDSMIAGFRDVVRRRFGTASEARAEFAISRPKCTLTVPNGTLDSAASARPNPRATLRETITHDAVDTIPSYGKRTMHKKHGNIRKPEACWGKMIAGAVKLKRVPKSRGLLLGTVFRVCRNRLSPLAMTCLWHLLDNPKTTLT